MRKPIKYLPYDKLEKLVNFWRKVSAILFILFIVVAWYANGLRVDNIKKNKQVAELQKYKCAWEDFNRTHILETALPRIKEIEDIYLERI